MQSVKPIHFQLGQIHDALEKVGESTIDPKIKSKAQSLAENEFNFELISYFSSCCVVRILVCNR
jgi:hypothetical protein